MGISIDINKAKDIWKDKIREYDASFGVSRTKLMANLENKLSDWIK